MLLLISTCTHAQEKDSVYKNLSLSYFEKTLNPQIGYATIVSKYGKPSINSGSGIYILIYNLDDSASIMIGCDNNRILYARSSDKYGVKHDLIQILPPSEQNKTKQKNKKVSKEQVKLSQTNDCLEQFSRYDTTSANGNFLKYHVDKNSASIEYGNKTFKGSLPEQYDCQIPDSWIPRFILDTKDFMILRYGCGSPCWGILVLPLNSADPVKNIMYNMAFDTDNNLVAYLECDSFTSLIIENLKTSQTKRIEFTFKTDHGEFIGYWIDSISIKDHKLYYQYSDPNDNNERKIHTKVSIDIDL